MIQLRLQKRVLLQLTTNNTPTKDYSHTDDKTTRSNGTHGFKPFALKGQFNWWYHIPYQWHSWCGCHRQGNVLVSERWIDCTWGEIQSTDFENTPLRWHLEALYVGRQNCSIHIFSCLPADNNWLEKKLSWDKDVQTAATSFTALKILMWKEKYKLSRTNLATVYSK